MAWGKRGRPTYKVCRGYGRSAHRARYDYDFPKVYRVLKNGDKVSYAEPLCHQCRRAYERDLRRMNTRLSGRGNRPQDVPWKRYQSKLTQRRVDSGPFLVWFDGYVITSGKSIEEICRAVGVDSGNIRRYRRSQRMDLNAAQKFFQYAGKPYLESVLYDERMDLAA